MNLVRTLSNACLMVVFASVGCQAENQHAEEKNEGAEVKMKLDQVPPAVRETLTREAAGAAIGDVDKESDDGKTIYETDVMIGNQDYEIKVDESGKLLKKSVDDESTEKKDGEKKEEAK